MPGEYIAPGVYVEEGPGGVRPIAGASTSTAAFLGWAASGPGNRAVLCSSWADFERSFGGLDARGLLGYAVSHFFTNGGSRCHIVRLGCDEVAEGEVLAPGDARFSRALRGDGRSTGWSALDAVDSINLVNVPGHSDAADLALLAGYCRARRAMLLVDSAEGTERGAASMTGGPPAPLTGADAINAAYYYPWILAPDPLQANRPRAFPPCGAVAGVFARTDAARGVWKAPAGTHASLTGVSGPVVTVGDADSRRLNPLAVNCIRRFPGNGTLIWGARTLHGSDANGSEWKYVPVRRTALFIEESLDRALRWAVFEPNDEPLWAQVRSSVGTFLNGLFRQGAFQGSTPRDAFFVRCDRSTTTQADIDRGIAIVEVGFAPLKPAEFVIIRLQLIAGGQG